MIFSIMGLLKIFKLIMPLPIAYDTERIMKTFIYYNFHGIGFCAFYPPYYIQYFREDEFFKVCNDRKDSNIDETCVSNETRFFFLIIF